MQIALQAYPEWYNVEKETEKTIKSLTSLKELGFYLRNPDEYIRRLAILRINELKLRDSIEALKEVLEDHLESPANKNLAAWTIKAVSLKWDIDLFISNRLLSKFSGTEKYKDLCDISIKDSLPTVKFDFSSSLISSELGVNNDSMRQSQDVSFDTQFPFKDWFAVWSHEYAAYIKKLLVNLPMTIFKILKRLFIFIYLKFRSRLQQKRRTNYASISPVRTNYLELIKTAIVNLLYIVFAPIRLIFKHKRFTAIALAATYCFLTFNTYGQAITYRYFGLDLAEIQNNTYTTSKQIISYAWSEAKSIAGINEKPYENSIQATHQAITQAVVQTQELSTQYRVIAKTGLNLRKAPDGASDKISTTMLEYNSVVTYLSKSHKDSKGAFWQFVQTSDGKAGWVYAKWLEKVGGE